MRRMRSARFFAVTTVLAGCLAAPSSGDAADQVTTLQCFGFLRPNVQEFDNIFSINAGTGSVNWIDKEAGSHIEGVKFTDREVSFITTFERRGDTHLWLKWTINRYTQKGILQELNVEVYGTFPNYTTNFSEGKRSGPIGCKVIDASKRF